MSPTPYGDPINLETAKKVAAAAAAELQKRNIQYDTGYTLLPGAYTVKVLARDAETGRIGTPSTPIVP